MFIIVVLFIVINKDITSGIKSNISLLADDRSFFESIENLDITFQKLNRDLGHLNTWSTQWLVTFNPTKTEHILFSKTLQKPDFPLLYFAGKQISRVCEHSHLGLTLDEQLCLRHITQILCKGNKKGYDLQRLNLKIPRHT